MNLNKYFFKLKLTTFLKLRLIILNLFIFYTSCIFSINIDDDRVDEFEGIEDYSAVVYVKVGNSICTGALINYRTVLTAAHCLIEGQKGWHPSFFSEEVFPQWKNLRNILIKSFGEKRKSTDFPEYSDVPLDDLGGKVTDSWELEDRLMLLAVRSFMVKDCCTEELLEYSCCTLLIQPKK